MTNRPLDEHMRRRFPIRHLSLTNGELEFMRDLLGELNKIPFAINNPPQNARDFHFFALVELTGRAIKKEEESNG